MSFDRRKFLKVSGGIAAGALGGILLPGRARAFGENPSGTEGVTVPEDLRAFNILEIFLFGGLSPYESFYVVEDYGKSDSTQWHLFTTGGNEVQAAVENCGYSTTDLLNPFALDGDGAEVNLGPFVAPLRARPDIISRMRIVTTAHDALPHEAAVPLMLTGRSSSHPMVAGIGAHIQRYFQQIEGRSLPYAYVLLPQSQLQLDLTRVSLARGPHPSTARPLALQVSAGGSFQSLLERPSMNGQQAAYDALLSRRTNRYWNRLLWNGQGDPLRAPSAEQLADAARTISSSAELKGVLQEGEFFTLPPGLACGETVAEESVGQSLRLATHLLTHPQSPARYVCVVDGGFKLETNAAGGYDTHNYAAGTQAENLYNILNQLASLVQTPGDKDPTKIDLDRTLVVLTTEFGRTPFEEGIRGRGHWPFGYPTMYLGGPIRPVSSPVGTSNGGIFGALGPSGHATTAATPTQIRMSMLMALGIWPFANESFNVSDVPGVGSEHDGARLVREQILGVES
jgi:hypothetical protein